MVHVPAPLHWFEKGLCHHLMDSDGPALLCGRVVGCCLEVSSDPIQSQGYFIKLPLGVAVRMFKSFPVHDALASHVESVFLKENH